MFSGLVYCADCGKPMVLHRAHSIKPEQVNFTCRTYKKDGADVCTAHYIREVALKAIVLETIRRTAEFARNYPEKFAEYSQQKQSTEVAKEIKSVERELSAMRKRDAELDVVFKRMYEDSALSRVSNEQFRLFSEAYSKDAPQEVHIRFRDFDRNNVTPSMRKQQERQTAQMHCLPDSEDTPSRYPYQE